MGFCFVLKVRNTENTFPAEILSLISSGGKKYELFHLCRKKLTLQRNEVV